MAFSPIFHLVRAYGNAPGGPNTCWVGNFRVGIFGGGTNLGSGSPVTCLSSLDKTEKHIFSENGQKQPKTEMGLVSTVRPQYMNLLL